MSTQLIPCGCRVGSGHLVEITYPNSPGVAPCCSCSVAKYETLYGKPTFTVTPLSVCKEAGE